MALTLNYSRLGNYGKKSSKKVTLTVRTITGSGSSVRVINPVVEKPKAVEKPKLAKKPSTRRNRWEDDSENSLRRMEAYGAYLASGCVSSFWEDDTWQGGRW